MENVAYCFDVKVAGHCTLNFNLLQILPTTKHERRLNVAMIL